MNLKECRCLYVDLQSPYTYTLKMFFLLLKEKKKKEPRQFLNFYYIYSTKSDP